MTTTTTPTSGAADLPKALRLAEEITELMCSTEAAARTLAAAADELVRLHAESEMRRAALLDEMQKAALAAGRATAAQPGVVYAELPVPNYPKSGGFPGTFAEAQMCAFADATHAIRASHGQAPAQAADAAVGHDEDLLEKLYWEFDSQRKKTGEERLAFKVKMRFYASEFLRRSDGKMTFAQSVSDDMMDLADRLGSEFDDVDPRAWKHLLVYAPKAAPADVAPPSAITASIMRDDGGEQPAPSPAPAEPDMRAVVAVAVTMLYESHPDDVLRTFTIAELAEIVRITEAMGSEQVEAIYKRARDALAVRITFHPAQADSQPAPIDMVLHCPACGLQHVDAPDAWRPGSDPLWDNPPHRSHLCHGCGHIWRPADVPTNGMEAVKTRGKADSPIAARALADSVLEDAARYRYLRDGDWREHEKLESVIRLQLNALWDETIDAARKQGEKQ